MSMVHQVTLNSDELTGRYLSSRQNIFVPCINTRVSREGAVKPSLLFTLDLYAQSNHPFGRIPLL